MLNPSSIVRFFIGTMFIAACGANDQNRQQNSDRSINVGRPAISAAAPDSGSVQLNAPYPPSPVQTPLVPPPGAAMSLADMTGYTFQLALDNEFVYWAEYTRGNGLWRVPRSGGAKQQIASVNPYARGVVADKTHVYFTSDAQADGLGGPPVLYRVGKSGGPVELVAREVQSGHLATDGQRVFWLSNTGLFSIEGAQPATLIANVHGSNIVYDRGRLFYHRDKTIYRLPLGSGKEVKVADTEAIFREMAVDSDFVYWSESGPLEMPPPPKCRPGIPCAMPSAVPRMPNGIIKRASLADGSITTLATKQDNVGEVAVDNTHVYWASSEAVVRVNKLGGPAQVVHAFQGRGAPHPMSISSNLLYFAAGGTVYVRSVD
ncbi:MAG: hypothetical protein IPK82_06510 [Polyangiaceae bacterium]|nr:hypothetical protein [Polyangiaceae bacterium]